MNLVLALLGTRRGRDRDYLRENIRGYDANASNEAFGRMFERDKVYLKKLGIPISSAPDPLADDVNSWLYRIDPKEYRLPEIRLDAAGLAVVQLAAQVWEQASLGSAAVRALRKLETVSGGLPAGDGGAVQSRIRTEEPAFDGLWEALRGQHPVRFNYRGPHRSEDSARHVQPWGLGNKYGQWYLSGRDIPTGGQRLFRLSRITSDVEVDAKTTFARPEDFDIATVLDALGTGTESTAIVDVAEGTAARLREDAVVAPAPAPGWDRLTLHYREPELMAATLAALGPAAVVVAPEQLRSDVLDRLTGAAEAAAGALVDFAFPGKPAPARSRASTEDRLRRLLDMVPYLLQNPGIEAASVATEFGITAAELEADLGLLSVCGLPGGYHGDLIDVGWEDGVVFILDPQELTRPLRLTQEEACAVLVGLAALRSLPSADGGAVLDKVQADVLAIAGDQAWLANAVEARITADAPLETITTLQELVRTHGCAHITYVKDDGAAPTERTIEPLRVFSVDSRWYVQAWCRLAEGQRTFRLSGITALAATGEQAPDRGVALDGPVPSRLFTPSSDDVEVVLVLARRAAWVADAYSADAVAPLAGGGTAVRIRTSRPPVIAALVAQLGGGGRVASPPAVVDAVDAWLGEALAGYAARPLDAGTEGTAGQDAAPGTGS